MNVDFIGTRHVGFTGTRRGLTELQRATLKKVLADLRSESDCDLMIFHHGDCVGADAEAHHIAKSLHYQVVIHPPVDERYRAYCYSDYEYLQLPFLERNRAIVNACSVLIVCPKEMKEIQRSGTWATFRYGKKQKKRIILIQPDG